MIITLLKSLQSINTIITPRERVKIVFLMLLMFAAAVFEAAGVGAVPLFIAFAMEPARLNDFAVFSHFSADFPETPTVKMIGIASGMLFCFVLFKSSFLTLVYYFQSRIIFMQCARLANRMFIAYQKAPYDWLIQRSTAELIRNIQTDTSKVIGGVLTPALDLCLSLLMTVLIVALIIATTTPISLLSLLIIGLGSVLVITSMRKHMNEIGTINRTESALSLRSIQQGFGSIIDARTLGCEAYLSNLHRRSMLRSAKASITQSTLSKLTPQIIELLAVVGLLLVFSIFIASGVSLVAALPSLAVVGISVMRLKQISSRVATAFNTINQSTPYVPQLMEDIKTLTAFEKIDLEAHDGSDEKEVIEFKELRINKINYTYPNTTEPAIKEISIHLKKGESIALIGETGCGKSTLVNAILGFLKPQSGSIEVNGIHIHKNLRRWLNCVGYIPQQVSLSNGSLAANIAFGIEEDQIDQDQLIVALECASLTKFVKTLPEGLNTVIGEQGVRLSGGQRQRLGIARAVYFNPQVLVLDEATSALDTKTETEVIDAINNLKKDRTCIMIAHRLSTVENCERIYRLADGKIVQQGDYESVIQHSETTGASKSINAECEQK